MYRRQYFLLGLLFLLAMALTGCDEYADLKPADIAGTYVYVFRTGQVEELTLNADLTFHQAFFNNSEEFIGNRHAQYTNDGRWKQHRNDVGGELLDYSDLSTLLPKLPPTIVDYDGGEYSSLGWVPHFNGADQPVLLRAEDMGDIMQRLPKRENITDCVWRYPSL